MVALDWVDLTNVTSGIFIGSVMCSILSVITVVDSFARTKEPLIEIKQEGHNNAEVDEKYISVSIHNYLGTFVYITDELF